MARVLSGRAVRRPSRYPSNTRASESEVLIKFYSSQKSIRINGHIVDRRSPHSLTCPLIGLLFGKLKISSFAEDVF